MIVKRSKSIAPTSIEVNASSMGGIWAVSFRLERKGFSAWLTVGCGFPESVRKYQVGEPLTWRSAAMVLADQDEDGLKGDWISRIVVTGVDGWRAEILKMAAITSESPYYDRLLLLLELDESEIEAVVQEFGTLLSDEAEQYILQTWGDDPPEPEPILCKNEKISDLVAITDKPAPESKAECIDLLSRWAAAEEKPIAIRVNHVSWSDERSWFVWIFKTAPDDLLWAFENASTSAAADAISWLRKEVVKSEKENQQLRVSRNQAAQIGVGLTNTFIALATKQLNTYDYLRKGVV
jgi:hypothetical protein